MIFWEQRRQERHDELEKARLSQQTIRTEMEEWEKQNPPPVPFVATVSGRVESFIPNADRDGPLPVSELQRMAHAVVDPTKPDPLGAHIECIEVELEEREGHVECWCGTWVRADVMHRPPGDTLGAEHLPSAVPATKVGVPGGV